METVRWEELISENLDLEARSDTQLEQNKNRLSKDASRRKKADPDKESRVIPHLDVGLAVQRTETSLSVKLAKKKTKDQKVKEKPWWALRGSGAWFFSSQDRCIYFRHKKTREERSLNSQLWFGEIWDKCRAPADLQIYANRRPKEPSGKITEDLINQHSREARKKLEGNKKIKHRKIADDASAVSSIQSNVTRALKVRLPTKPKEL